MVFKPEKKTFLDVWPENLMKAAPFENGWPPLFGFEVIRHPQLDLEDHPGGVAWRFVRSHLWVPKHATI